MDYPPATNPPSPIQFPINHPSPGKSSQFRFTALHCPCCYLFSNSHSSTWYPTLCATATRPPTRSQSPRIASQSADQVQSLKHKSARPLAKLTCKQKALRSRAFPDIPTSLALCERHWSPPPPVLPRPRSSTSVDCPIPRIVPGIDLPLQIGPVRLVSSCIAIAHYLLRNSACSIFDPFFFFYDQSIIPGFRIIELCIHD